MRRCSLVCVLEEAVSQYLRQLLERGANACGKNADARTAGVGLMERPWPQEMGQCTRTIMRQ
jgi:hypothetical protein